MKLLSTTVIKPSGWVLKLASRRRALLWCILVVGVFSVTTAVGALASTPLPDPEPGMEGVVQVGLALGFVLGIGAGFLLWLYLAVGTCLVLKSLSRSPALAEVVRLAGISLIFPLAGRSASLALQALPVTWLPTTAYLLSVVWGVAVLSRAITTSTGGPWLPAAFAVLVPVAATQIPRLLFALP